MLKYHLAITVIMRNRFVKKQERLNQKTNLPSLLQVPVTAMHSKANISNNPAIMDIKSLSSTGQKLDVVVLPSDNEKSKKKYNIFLRILLPIREQKFLPIFIIISEINCEINQILRAVESMKISMNVLTSLIREVIQRLDALEKNSVSLKIQSVLDEDNTLGRSLSD